MLGTILVMGAGNGGKATAVDLALQGHPVRLWELPRFESNLAEIKAPAFELKSAGQVEGSARLEFVTTDLEHALTCINPVDTIMVCTQALAHESLAEMLAPHVSEKMSIVLNPGSTGGALLFHRVFRNRGVNPMHMPVLVEFGTLTYGCRAHGNQVNVALKPNAVAYGTLPSEAIQTIGPCLEKAFPGLFRCESTLHAGLTNANPVIHPSITLLNAARIEKNTDESMLFYKDGVSPSVAKLIKAIDGERIALARALGYEVMPDTEMSVRQGYASHSDYLQCYGFGEVFATFTAPSTLDHRYLHEDVGMGLVFFSSLGQLINVPTPGSDALITLGNILSGVDYKAQGKKTVETLGINGLTIEQIRCLLHNGELPSSG